MAGAAEVVVWGSGRTMREFLYVDDMAEACLHVMNLAKETYAGCTEPMLSHINVGTGIDCSIRELAETMAEVVGFQGKIVFDIGGVMGDVGTLSLYKPENGGYSCEVGFF